MSKLERAIAIVKSNPSASRGDLIGMFMSQLSMSKAGATTYYYNASKGMERTEKTVKAAKVVLEAAPVRTASAAQIMKAAERAKARKQSDEDVSAREAERAKILKELDEFVNDIDGYDFPHGTLPPLRAPKVVDQDKLEEIKEKNLATMKKVQKTFIQDVA
ncbi:hypothetical protein UFOVP245_1 [uncultured Caudovirales phage]|uniref:Uncharacterized protein n=1 Tax=uncultured Caudovirales phage TaxID=2100421 RepID=A0A6J7WS89_9CAUD|nr:hypothetical protein UFOVP245_1 [uncultured Caudovirales phage]